MWSAVTALAALVCLASDNAMADDPPAIVDFLDRDLVDPGDVNYTSSLLLPCTAIGGNLKYTWFYNDVSVEALDPLGKVFEIFNNGTLAKTQAVGGYGEYRCVVKNSRGTTFSRKLKIRVTEHHHFKSGGSDITLRVSLGRPAVLNCPDREIKTGFGVTFSWKKDFNGKVQVFEENERRAITPEGNMHIMYVTQQDINKIRLVNGLQCRITAGGQYEDSVSINVQGDGTTSQDNISPSFITKPSEVESAREGYRKELRCIATGKPAPVITWKKDGKMIVDGKDSFKLSQFKRTLVITKVDKRKHDGKYVCEAKSANAPPIQAFTNLTVKALPYWTPGKKLAQKIIVNYEENATLTCSAEGIPSPSYKWYRDDIVVQPYDHLTTDNNKLHFREIQKDQDSVYHCVVKNDVGNIVSSTWVYVNMDGGWSEFGPWGQCSKSCGIGGSQERRRTCTSPPPAPGGAVCFGSNRETQACSDHPCPVNGNWSDFGSWGECSESCEGGKQMRKRQCTSPPPAHGGASCLGSDQESRPCNESPCPAASQRGLLTTPNAIIVFICVISAVLLLGVVVVVYLVCPIGKCKATRGWVFVM